MLKPINITYIKVNVAVIGLMFKGDVKMFQGKVQFPDTEKIISASGQMNFRQIRIKSPGSIQ